MREIPELHEPIHIMRTITGVRNPTLQYDTDLFQEDMVLSVSLLFGPDEPGVTHYNTIHTELETDLYAHGVLLHGTPKPTPILGMKFPPVPTITRYFISIDYDHLNEYTYTWYIISGNATLVNSNAKEAFLSFAAEGNTVLGCTITNAFGGTRNLQLLINAGQQPKKIMVVRNAAIKG